MKSALTSRETLKGWSSCDISWGGGECWIPGYSVLVPQFRSLPLGTNKLYNPNDENSDGGSVVDDGCPNATWQCVPCVDGRCKCALMTARVALDVP